MYAMFHVCVGTYICMHVSVYICTYVNVWLSVMYIWTYMEPYYL